MPGFPTRTEIESGQLGRLRELLAAIVPGNRFYTAKLAGIHPSLDSLADLSRLPFTTKAELAADQEKSPPFGTNLTFALEQYTRFHQTSGTTRAPLRWLDTAESWRWMIGHWLEVYRAAGVGPADRAYFAFSFGPFIGLWLAFEAAQELGCLCIPGGGAGSPGRLRAIIDNGATVLCSTPSYALRLGEVAAEQGIDLGGSAVRAIIVAGEPGGSVPATRQRLQRFWPKAAVFDHHGMTETGPVSFQCPKRPGALHIIESAYVPEVVDVAGKAAGAGAAGELVLTCLGRRGSPLLRYRTGDLVRAGAPGACACGRHDMVLEGGILGRVDEMAIIRGVNIYPAAVENIVLGFAEVAEFRAWVDRSGSLAELRVEIEPAPGCDPGALVRRLESALHAAFQLRAPVSLAAPGTLPRAEMKSKRWQSAPAV